jgi:hypothetical protein
VGIYGTKIQTHSSKTFLSLSFGWHYCHFPCRNRLGMSSYTISYFLCRKFSLPPVAEMFLSKWNRKHDTYLTIKSWHLSSTCKHSKFNTEKSPRITLHFPLLWRTTTHSLQKVILSYYPENCKRQKWKTILAVNLFYCPLQASFQRLLTSYARMHPQTYVHLWVTSQIILWNVATILVKLQNIQFNYSRPSI